MEWRLLTGSIGALLLALASACEGGQTGQPTSLDCSDVTPVAADSQWQGVTPAQVAEAFEGTHTSSLQWLDESSGETQVVALENRIAITVVYEGASAESTLCGLALPVRLDVETEASAIRESGATMVQLSSADAPLRGSFELNTTGAQIVGTLTELASGLPPTGALIPSSTGAPGTRARFPAEGSP